MARFPITRTTTPKQKPADDSLAFGRVLTDHMFLMDYTEGEGWHSPRILPYGPLSLDPATTVLHYGQAIFDGLKAFRGADDKVRLFRADRHAERFNRSAKLMCMPELPVDVIRQSFDALVGLEADWVPRKRGTSLYLRPTIIATDVMLGVHPAHSYLYFLILSPVGSYYKEGVKPVRILATDSHVRAVKGGTGEAKTAANYAQSLAGQRDAEAAGYTQVLYLDGVHRKYLDEVGTMNIMVKIGDEVITPPLAGTILDGVTRASALELMRDWGLKVTERPITIDEVMQAGRDGTLKEMWGTGTAAVVSPVGTLGYKGEDVLINGGQTGELTQKLYDAITAIQYGRSNDPHGWTSLVPAVD
ncbi:branched-chain amino acid aminotransferase [Siccirubricoccus sp. KC 17139]|uniref:Probable branched-chain-amino-acid aminotransferase n=1 Tax=Siccirubricoccus soli TaxID=2899147 RepID=A0ABT1D6M5_9PROT|nr:branched-chain amino acid aminotransferase [Siccirubricoccus soli]MCO6417242.1 branched-chain amino acid aminotransferase [Siccirubricoccus soli]MCP2683377.1 branched-chain amino acid aminotransferase [Siccirubricoccus soli]